VRAEAGEPTDVVMTLRGMLDDLSKQDKAEDVVTVGRSFIAVVVPTGKPKPEIASVAAFKQTLLAAKSIVHSDPTKGGLSGVFAARLIKSMAIDDQIRPKLKLVPPGGKALVAAIASGEAELGIDQLTVVEHKPGVDVVGVLSEKFGVDIVMGAAVSTSAREPAAAAKFVKFLSSPTAAPTIKAHGMQPD
jgi:molybdate transport system substrate-binding protein